MSRKQCFRIQTMMVLPKTLQDPQASYSPNPFPEDNEHVHKHEINCPLSPPPSAPKERNNFRESKKDLPVSSQSKNNTWKLKGEKIRRKMCAKVAQISIPKSAHIDQQRLTAIFYWLFCTRPIGLIVIFEKPNCARWQRIREGGGECI